MTNDIRLNFRKTCMTWCLVLLILVKMKVSVPSKITGQGY
jgi:hypothetical protein